MHTAGDIGHSSARTGTVSLQVSVCLPLGVKAHLLSDRRGRAALMRGASGAEALAAEFSASQAIVVAGEAESSSPEVIEDEVLENERAMPFKGFKAAHLLPLDPKQCDTSLPCIRV